MEDLRFEETAGERFPRRTLMSRLNNLCPITMTLQPVEAPAFQINSVMFHYHDDTLLLLLSAPLAPILDYD